MRYRMGVLLLIAAIGLTAIPSVTACGGFFCQNVPVDQQAERIIFTVNDNDTITAYVQINYVGSAPDFSWVVPVPSVPEVDVAEIATFDELSSLTAPVFIPPDMPDCAQVVMFAASVPESASADDTGVVVLASGTAGPYQYDVITSPEPNELITWLRTNNYQITEQMEPLVKVYTDEGMVFLAMKLQPDQGVADIQPVVMTYESTEPMIPLRLTAVAAVPNMNVITWIFADEQAYPTNYAHPEIEEENLRFFPFSGNNYLQLVDMTVDLYNGRAFITEYAQSTGDFARQTPPADPLLRELLKKYDYVTRFFVRISPEEMIIDPMFEFDSRLPDVPNTRDVSYLDPEVAWGCKDVPINVEYDMDAQPEDLP